MHNVLEYAIHMDKEQRQNTPTYNFYLKYFYLYSISY